MEGEITKIIIIAFGVLVPIVGVLGYRALNDVDKKIDKLFTKTDKIDSIETNQEWIIKLGGFDIPKKNTRE